MKPILLIGYGNPTRMDDGVGWYIADKIQNRFMDEIEVWQADQLSIEMIDDIKDREVLILVDDHISDKDDYIRSCEIEPDASPGMISHIIKPSNLLAFCESIYHKHPKTYLYSIKGIAFDFGEELSAQTKKSADEVIMQIADFISKMRNID